MTALLKIALGLGLVGLVVWLRGGVGGLWHELDAAGLEGILIVSLIHAVPQALCGLGWRSLLAGGGPALTATFVLARWIRDAVNQLIPFMPLGGEVVGARLVGQRGGISGPVTAALTVVDLTAEVVSQAVFSIIGIGLWLADRPLGAIMGPAGIGVALCLPMVGGLVLAQKLGMVRLLERLADKVMPEAWKSSGESTPIHQAIVDIYADRRRFLAATLFHLAGWLVACAEAWTALRLLGHPIPLSEAIALESVIYAVRSASFLVPGALGVQEGAYVLVGAALGLPSEVALAVSLMKRGREVMLGVPALLAWQWLGKTGEARKAS